jgi:hypothetical protein
MSQHYVFVGSYTGFEPEQLVWVGSKQPGVYVIKTFGTTEPIS